MINIAKSMRVVVVLMVGATLMSCNVVMPGDNGTLIVFSDPDSSFSTTDVRDVDDEIMQFDINGTTLIWKTDDSTHTNNWSVDGNFLNASQSFQVRFGSVNGEQRAYFTETGPATICNLTVSNGNLSISSTNTTVPNS